MASVLIPFGGPSYARCSRQQRRLARRAVLDVALVDEPGINEAALGWARAAARVTLVTTSMLLACAVVLAVHHDPRWLGFLLVTLANTVVAVHARRRSRAFNRLVDPWPGRSVGWPLRRPT